MAMIEPFLAWLRLSAWMKESPLTRRRYSSGVPRTRMRMP
jgi:hypothetical protein